MLRAMLSPHIETLKSVGIGVLSDQGSGQLFDASEFPKLERLGLSRSVMPKEVVFSPADASLLLGPRLKNLEWDSRIDHTEETSYIRFDEKAEGRLREFLRVAVNRKVALKNVAMSSTRVFLELGTTTRGTVWTNSTKSSGNMALL